ncbi:hypothetical protein LSM04_008977, partial [Trypanosoma melophagium]|uniref:uncharacterized protein n=1 Tax=Trypanosoma melophagium TaxID=715481 RepID=UPI003519FF26
MLLEFLRDKHAGLILFKYLHDPAAVGLHNRKEWCALRGISFPLDCGVSSGTQFSFVSLSFFSVETPKRSTGAALSQHNRIP